MVENRFSKGPEGWCSYDYHASVVGNSNIFVLATWDKEGGVDNSGYIWSDHTRWSADTPEKPLSILPLIFYRSWVNEDPIDLRDAQISVFLRGEDLELDGARCLFWIHGVGNRWHLDSRPLEITKGEWSSEPLRFPLPDDEALWHHSWSASPQQSKPLSEILGHALSYGFSFVGFSSEVKGRLCMGRFEISAAR